MKIIPQLFRRSPRQLLFLALLGMLSGASSAFLLALINEAVTHQDMRFAILVLFISGAAMKVASSMISNLMLVQFTQDTVLSLCRTLSMQVLRTPYRKLEQIGAGRVLATLTDDVAMLSAAILAIPALTVNAAVLAGAALYLIHLSLPAFLIIGAVGAAGSYLHHRLTVRAYAAIRRAQGRRDQLFGHFRDLVDGIKELKMSQARRAAFVEEEIAGASRLLANENIIATRQFSIADGWSQSLFLLVLFMLLFGMPRFHVLSRDALSGYAFAALYCMTPVWGILSIIPALKRGEAAWERLSELGGLLETRELEPAAAEPARSVPPTIEFRNVHFRYESSSGAGFCLGPINFRITPGELIFIIGGNGSGKSTLVKLLSGLYAPTEGEILVDGEPIEMTNADAYREMFSIVFSDFHLFTRLHSASGADFASDAAHYLRALRLEEKAHINGNRLSTVALSQGQRRRLALLSAYLEDRPVYVLDEWAADQDPAFRQVFYTDLLADLRARGKSVIVVTHDDRYFHLGDRLLKLDYGKLVETDRNGTNPQLAVEAQAARVWIR